MHGPTPTFLRQHFLFAGLSDPQFARIAATARQLPIRDGQEVFRAGDPAERFFLVESGLIQLYRLSAAGEEKVIELVRPGQTFAEALMFMERRRYPVSARAIGDSTLIGFAMAPFHAVLQESPATCLRLLGAMSQRLHQLLQEIDHLSLHNATARVVRLLLQAAPEAGAKRYAVEWQTPKQVLASRLSVRPETFSRILKQLSHAGLIRVHGRKVEVLDGEGLERWAAGPE